MTRRASSRTRGPETGDVLAAARAMIATIPVGEFSVRELAKSMGVVPGTIYARFGSKDELLAQVFLERIDQLLGELGAGELEPVDTLEEFVAVFSPRISRIRLEFELHFMHEAAGAPAVTPETWKELRARFAVLSRALYTQFAKLASAEGVTLAQSSMARRLMWNVLASITIPQSDVAYRHSNLAYRRFVTTALLNALAAPGAPRAAGAAGIAGVIEAGSSSAARGRALKGAG